jgi:plasmid stabilization system protein ParE
VRIRWTVPAVADLEGISHYLHMHYPRFAEPTVRTIYRRIRSLKTSPERGRPGHGSGTGELTITPLPYVVYLQVSLRSLSGMYGWPSWWSGPRISQ